MQRKAIEPTFVDMAVSDLGSPRARAFFDECDKHIPWSEIADSVKDIFPAKEPDAAGRPHWPVVTMLKILLMQKWFNLSDPMMEEMLMDRLSFRRFVGLSLEDKTPDHSTLCRFRQRLLKAGHASTLFDKALESLRSRGLVLQEGTLVDATIIEAPLGQKRDDGSSTLDPCATKTAKRNRAYNGFRAHIATDTNGIIKTYVFDTAKTSEHEHFDALIEGEKHAVYADSGYSSKERREALEAKGIKAMISHRRVRGQAELTREQKEFNSEVAHVRAKVEHPFAWLRRMMGGKRVRYRGLLKNAFDFAVSAVAYNFWRSFSMVQSIKLAV